MQNINDVILNYLYEHQPNNITCDCILSNDNYSAKCQAVIKQHDFLNDIGTIEIKGEFKDYIKFFNKNDENFIHIYSKDFPQYFKCILNNFPQENMRNKLLKNVQIEFPKVRILSNLTLTLTENSTFNGEIQPFFHNEELMILKITK